MIEISLDNFLYAYDYAAMQVVWNGLKSIITCWKLSLRKADDVISPSNFDRLAICAPALDCRRLKFKTQRNAKRLFAFFGDERLFISFVFFSTILFHFCDKRNLPPTERAQHTSSNGCVINDCVINDRRNA